MNNKTTKKKVRDLAKEIDQISLGTNIFQCAWCLTWSPYSRLKEGRDPDNPGGFKYNVCPGCYRVTNEGSLKWCEECGSPLLDDDTSRAWLTSPDPQLRTLGEIARSTAKRNRSGLLFVDQVAIRQARKESVLAGREWRLAPLRLKRRRVCVMCAQKIADENRGLGVMPDMLSIYQFPVRQEQEITGAFTSQEIENLGYVLVRGFHDRAKSYLPVVARKYTTRGVSVYFLVSMEHGKHLWIANTLDPDKHNIPRVGYYKTLYDSFEVKYGERVESRAMVEKFMAYNGWSEAYRRYVGSSGLGSR